jgi:hypothetical protein
LTPAHEPVVSSHLFFDILNLTLRLHRRPALGLTSPQGTGRLHPAKARTGTRVQNL